MYFVSGYNISNLGIFARSLENISKSLVHQVISLVYEKHVDSLCKRVSSGLAASKQARQDIGQDTLLTIYSIVI